MNELFVYFCIEGNFYRMPLVTYQKFRKLFPGFDPHVSPHEVYNESGFKTTHDKSLDWIIDNSEFLFSNVITLNYSGKDVD